MTMFLVSDDILERLICSQCKKYLSVQTIKVYPNRGIKCGRCSTVGDAGVVSLYGVLAKEALFRCINRFDGCNQLLSYLNVAEHEKSCVSQEYDCPCCTQPFKGTAYETYIHFKEQHPEQLLLNNPEFVLSIDNEFVFSIDNEFVTSYLYRKNDLLFYINVRYSRGQKELILSITYFGTNSDARKITQMFTLYSLDTEFNCKTQKKCCCSVTEGNMKYFKVSISTDERFKSVVCRFDLNTENVESLIALPGNLNIHKQSLDDQKLKPFCKEELPAKNGVNIPLISKNSQGQPPTTTTTEVQIFDPNTANEPSSSSFSSHGTLDLGQPSTSKIQMANEPANWPFTETMHRTLHTVAQESEAALGDKGGGGNGGVRERTNRNKTINMKPANFETKKGVNGQPIKLMANYFKLMHWGLNQYRVDFVPGLEYLDDTRVRKRLVYDGMKNHKVTGYLFDGTFLYTPNRLHPEPLEFVVSNERKENIRVTIHMVAELAWGDHHYIQLFNIIVRKCLTFMEFKLLGRNYYDPKLKVSIPEHNLELWPGFFTSMRQHEQNILINADLLFKVLRTDNVYDLMLNCGKSQNPKQEFQQRCIGSIVLTSYNQKTYRIDDVDFNQNPSSTFKKRDGSEISYRQYFEDRYRVRINNDNQPMLISRSKKREIRAGMPELVLLVPELCIMTGLTDRQRENFHLMKAMGEHTRVGPADRMQKLREFIQRLQRCPEAVEEVKRWDLQLSKDMVELQGRVLPQEALLLGNNQPIYGGDEADWTRNLRRAPMFNIQHIDKLAVLVPRKFKEGAYEFTNCLLKVAKEMSFNITKHKIFDMNDDRSQTYLDLLEHLITNMNPRMCLVVLPTNSADRYNAVKKKCYVDRAMPCQVILAKNLQSKGILRIAAKVAIQMNCKAGGAPWGTSMPKNIMVCGFDVCRDTAKTERSFAGMVASMDSACTQYFSMAIEHEEEQELSSNIGAYMLLACKKYLEANKVLPERIIIYRDGVGEGQIPYVKEHEVELVKKKLIAELYQNQPLKMAFIVVSKRINTKIFRCQGVGPKNDYNPPPGTVVDDVITLPNRYDFYIVSQCVRQGTVAPTSYVVIEDTLGIDANRLQRFTFKICHMYFNWSGTVRVPAPCQYAHKLAFLTAQSLHRAASPGLNNTLYYL